MESVYARFEIVDNIYLEEATILFNDLDSNSNINFRNKR